MATYTVFASPLTSGIDGLSCSNADYSVARSGTGTLATRTDGIFGQQNVFGTSIVFESFLEFSIPELEGSVSEAKLNLRLTASTAAAAWVAEIYEIDFGASVTTADWVPGASLDAGDILAELPSSSFSVNNFNEFSDAGLGDVVASEAVFRCLAASSHTRLGSAPAFQSSSSLSYNDPDTSGTSQDPFLDITTEEEEEAAEVDVTDDLFVALAEESTLSATLAREDDLTVAVSEEAAILASLARMDSVSTLLAEAAAILVPRSGEDTLAAFLADMSAIAAAISAADDLGLLLTETSVLAVMLARQDSAIVALDEVVTIQAALNRADDLGIALSEAVTILAALLRSDTLHAALGELASLSIAASVEDALSPYLVELADLEILTVAIAAADTLAPYVVDVASLAVLLGRVDALHVQIDDVSDIAAFVNRLDALGVALSEAVQILATVTRTDELAVTLDDVATILGILAVLDEIAVFFTEASDVDAFDVVAKNVSDALGLTLAEASAVAIVLGREDSLGVHVSDEILSILVSLHRFDPILLNPAFDRARLFAGLADSLRRYEVPREFRSFAVERENRVLEIERDD